MFVVFIKRYCLIQAFVGDTSKEWRLTAFHVNVTISDAVLLWKLHVCTYKINILIMVDAICALFSHSCFC